MPGFSLQVENINPNIVVFINNDNNRARVIQISNMKSSDTTILTGEKIIYHLNEDNVQLTVTLDGSIKYLFNNKQSLETIDLN